MGDLNPFKSKKPDTSALEAQEKRIKEQEKEIAAQEKARKEAELARRQARRGAQGSRSLLSGLETGVAPEDEKRANLG